MAAMSLRKRKHPVTVAIDPDDLDEVDAYAKSIDESRSSVIQLAVRRLLDYLEDAKR